MKQRGGLEMSELPAPVPGSHEDAGTIVGISGAMTLPNAASIREQMVDAFEHEGKVIIDLSGVTEIDVVGLQLLCSGHRSSMLAGREYAVTGTGLLMVRDAAKSAGLQRRIGCALDTLHSCIWAGGKN
jgi:ABC-type transporter Mla MlaB component